MNRSDHNASEGSMTSPADKATDDVRGLVERLRAFADHLEPAADMYGQEIADVRSAADLITSLLERAERAEARTKELEQALGTAAVDLDEAAEEIEAWGAYASEYFQTKHDLDGCVKDVRDAAIRARSMKGGEG